MKSMLQYSQTGISAPKMASLPGKQILGLDSEVRQEYLTSFNHSFILQGSYYLFVVYSDGSTHGRIINADAASKWMIDNNWK